MTEQFPGAVLDLLDAAGDRTVFEHDGREVSGRQLLCMTRRVASGMRQHGIGPGRAVALLLGVGPEAFAAVIAAYTVGARVVGVRPGMTDDQQAGLLREAEVTVTVTDRPGGPDGTDLRPTDVVLPLGELLAA
ncbi:AMP-binding protein, partial [Streptomyces sp. SID5914]